MLLSLVMTVIPVRVYADEEDEEDIQAEIDALQDKKEELAGKTGKAQEKIDRLNEEKTALIEQKAAYEERNTYISEQIRLTGEQIELYRGLIEKKQLEVDAAKALEDEQLERIKEILIEDV